MKVPKRFKAVGPDGTAQCKDCGESKVKTIDREKPSSPGQYFYVDERGVRWDGRQCPACHVKAMNGRKRKRSKFHVKGTSLYS